MKLVIQRTAAVAALASVALGAGAQAQSTEERAQDEKKICRTEKMTGSLTRVRRICLTRQEWNAMMEAAKHGHEDNIRNAGGGCVAPGNPLAQPAMCGDQ